VKGIAGVALGVVVGLAIGAGVAKAGPLGFMSATKISGMGDLFQDGYAAGAYDMLSYVIELDRLDGSPADHMLYLRTKFACLDQRGDTVGVLKVWAQRQWAADQLEYPRDQAASLMIADACKP
jgi:hypothetical protein